jgi:hypothetical protein
MPLVPNITVSIDKCSSVNTLLACIMYPIGARTEYHMHGSSASGVTLKYFLAGYGSDI